MTSFNRRQFLEASSLAAGAFLLGGRGAASAPILPGVETVVAPMIAGEESSAQPDLWALEVRFKPVRMIQTTITNPRSGATGRELVWYLAYRAVVRPSSRVPEGLPAADRPLFVPEFTFVTEDEGKNETLVDRVLPQAQDAIIKRERHDYKNTVQVVGPLPEVTPDRAKQIHSLDGVATWTGIDSGTDFFAIYFTGFSNGYKVQTGPNGEEIVLRRTLVQKFWRPSDRFDQNESEIRLKDEAKWVYR